MESNTPSPALDASLFDRSEGTFGGGVSVTGLRPAAGIGGGPDVALLPGFAAAVGAVGRNVPGFKGLQAQLEAVLASGPGEITVFSAAVDRLPNTVCFALTGLEADTALMAFDLDGIAVSSGSACSSGKVQPSHVLQAMGASETDTRSAIRVSLGWSSTVEDVNRFSDSWQKIAARHVARAAAD